MAGVKGYKNPFDGLADRFGSLPNSVGNMHGPATLLHDRTMAPKRTMTGNGPGLGNPMGGALGGKSVQSPAQHAAVEKAAKASSGKRKRII